MCKHSRNTFGNTRVSFTEQHFYLPTILHFYTGTFLLHVRVYVCQRSFLTPSHNECMLVCRVVCCTHTNCGMSLATCILNGQQCQATTDATAVSGWQRWQTPASTCINVQQRMSVFANVQQLIKAQALNETHAFACAF